MTIKELYDWAVKNNATETKVIVDAIMAGPLSQAAIVNGTVRLYNDDFFE
jgi:hypothetical protein